MTLPYDPISDKELSVPLKWEIAWLAGECRLLMPSNGARDDPTRLPLMLNFVWVHGSPKLREVLMASHHSEVNFMLKTQNQCTELFQLSS